ncbi:MAG: hypothetical protein MZU79_00795 [Anaerotruncus sp.]|nr:hypothetical protein [Anaerotruncus sp.]
MLPYESCNLGSLNLARMVTARRRRSTADKLGRTRRSRPSASSTTSSRSTSTRSRRSAR